MADDAYGSVAMRVLLDGIEKAVFPVTENGCHVQYDGAFLYETEDGLHITIRNEAARVSSPLAAAAGFDVASQAMPPTATPSMATLPPTATPPPLSADSEREVWNTNKSKFLISKYKEFKEVIGKKGGFRTKKAMWEKLAQEINQEFQCHMTPLQVENKWKSMERAYKKTKIKNSSSGHSRAACEYEGYGQQTFSHHCFTHVPTQHNFFECGFLTESFPNPEVDGAACGIELRRLLPALEVAVEAEAALAGPTFGAAISPAGSLHVAQVATDNFCGASDPRVAWPVCWLGGVGLRTSTLGAGAKGTSSLHAGWALGTGRCDVAPRHDASA
ncbi:uncharacterized protein LOC142574679 [Dermacentor variabilis]|uniref:uncharacterized protein LOC142574679 n=1 Tax=Dermacentor variabilis TaxID=34621 RepID=UPI003F5B5854